MKTLIGHALRLVITSTICTATMLLLNVTFSGMLAVISFGSFVNIFTSTFMQIASVLGYTLMMIMSYSIPTKSK
jgi:hypothetical protein